MNRIARIVLNFAGVFSLQRACSAYSPTACYRFRAACAWLLIAQGAATRALEDAVGVELEQRSSDLLLFDEVRVLRGNNEVFSKDLSLSATCDAHCCS